MGTREGEGLVLRGRVSYLSLIVGFFFFTLFSFPPFFSSGTSLSLRGGRARPRKRARPGCELVSLREGGRDPGKERGLGVSRSLLGREGATQERASLGVSRSL